jgi:hypothetical protein
MTNWATRLAILAGAVIAAGALAGGRYMTSQGPQGTLYLVDRFTGAVHWCDVSMCRKLEDAALSAALPPEREDCDYQSFLKGQCRSPAKKP